MISSGAQAAWQRFTADSQTILGYEGLGGEQDLAAYSVQGKKPRTVLFPESISQVSRLLALAHDCLTPIIPAGSGTRLSLGGSVENGYAVLSLRRLDRVLDYQPANMILEVQAGITLDQIQKVTGEQAQWLPIDAPAPEKTTAGGVIAANVTGPLRHSQGTPRDLLIGVKIAQADGTVIKGGGKVVKNVAGYDLPRLYCGSLGTLGVIVEACFKVRPRPEREEIVCLSFSSIEAAMAFFFLIWNSEVEPLFLEFSNFSPFDSEAGPRSPHLTVSFAGVGEELEYQLAWLKRRLPPELRGLRQCSPEEKAEIKRKLSDFPVAGAALARFKAALLPSQIETFVNELESRAAKRHLTVPCQAHVSSGIVRARVAGSDAGAADDAAAYVAELRALAEALDGYLVAEEIDPSLEGKVETWGRSPAGLALMRALKKKLDPNGTLAGGRFVGGI